MGKFDGLLRGLGSLFKKKSAIIKSDESAASELTGVFGNYNPADSIPQRPSKDAFVSGAKKFGEVAGEIGTDVFAPELKPVSGLIGKAVGKKVEGNAKFAERIFSKFKGSAPNVATRAAIAADGSVKGAALLGFDKVKRFMKIAFIYFLLPAFGMFSVLTGLMPMNAWYTWVFLLSLGLFIFSLVTHKNVILLFSFIGMVITAGLFSNIFAVGPVANIFKYTGVEVEHANIAGYIGQSWKDIKCASGIKGFFGVLTGDFDQSDNVDTDCVKPLVDVENNQQESVRDISIVSFEPDTKRITSGSSISLTLNLKNEDDKSKKVSVKLSAPSDVPVTRAKDGNGNEIKTIGCEESNGICTAIIPAQSTSPIIWSFDIGSIDSEKEAKFDVSTTYSSNLISTLNIRVTDILTERGKICQQDPKLCESEATGGNANLIIAAPDQPFFLGNAFPFSINIKNNDPQKGLILNPVVRILVPTDVIENTNNELNTACPKPISYRTEYSECESRTRLGYSCLILDLNQLPVEQRIIEENKRYQCRFEVKDTLGPSRSVIGNLTYDYALTKSTAFIIEPL